MSGVARPRLSGFWGERAAAVARPSGIAYFSCAVHRRGLPEVQAVTIRVTLSGRRDFAARMVQRARISENRRCP